MYNDDLHFKNVNRPGNLKILTISGPPLKCRDGCSFPIEIIKVIPQYCIAHPYCARFLRH